MPAAQLSHAVQAALFTAGLYVFAGHWAHLVSDTTVHSAVMYQPAAQTAHVVQLLCPATTLNVDRATQGTHCASAPAEHATGMAFPAAHVRHWVHVVVSPVAQYPLEHDAHCVSERVKQASEMRVPALHRRHPVWQDVPK